MTVISMSRKELHRLRVVMDLVEERFTAAKAATQLHLTERQALRLRRRFLQGGAAGLASRKRGRASNRRFHPSVQMTAVSLVREHYVDFGPTFAAEKLAERHGLHVGRETLRNWMMAAGLWLDRKQRSKPVHQRAIAESAPVS